MPKSTRLTRSRPRLDRPPNDAERVTIRIISSPPSVRDKLITELPVDSPVDRVMRLLNSYRFSQAVSVAARLGIPDLLAHGGKTPEELAKLISAQPDPLYQILRASASCGVFAEDDKGCFVNTPMSECLRSDAPGPGRNNALLIGEVLFATLGELMHAVRTGTPAFDKVFGQPFFDFLSTHKELGQLFDAQMTALYQREIDALLNSYDFAGAGRILDVGGGRGTVVRALLARFFGLKCGLFDLPAVVDRARASFVADALIDRCAIEAGSFFETIPSGYDTYLLKHVLHDWDDARCVSILTNLRRAIGNDGRLLVLEHVVPPTNEPSVVKESDVLMLALLAGKERTEAEFQSLLAKTGFELVRVVHTASLLNVLEARPA
jgi:O-methyltransferase domain/Dimerisation domain